MNARRLHGPTAQTVLVATVALVTFATSLFNGFALDDVPLVRDNVEIRSEGSATVPPGQVIRSEPPANQMASVDSVITLYVSSGPAQVQVPRVVGLSREAAEAALTADDLQLIPQFVDVPLQPGDPRIGLVIDTNPPVGSTIFQGSTVQVRIGIEMQDTTTTPSTTQPTTASTDTTQPSSSTTESTTDG